jgi:hypothetical protein
MLRGSEAENCTASLYVQTPHQCDSLGTSQHRYHLKASSSPSLVHSSTITLCRVHISHLQVPNPGTWAKQHLMTHNQQYS